MGVDAETLAEETQITRTLLEFVANRAQENSSRLLRLALPNGIAEPYSDSMLENFEVRPSSAMARLLHRDNLLRDFSLELNERWIQGGRPAGSLTFATPYGPVSLRATPTFLQIIPSEVETKSALSQSNLFGMLFGLLDPNSLTEDLETRAFIAALFPRQPAVYWNADGF